jgi:hypothetical protein
MVRSYLYLKTLYFLRKKLSDLAANSADEMVVVLMIVVVFVVGLVVPKPHLSSKACLGK